MARQKKKIEKIETIEVKKSTDSVSYTVKPGDTVQSIAQKFHKSTQEIVASCGSNLYIGQRIRF